jgi:hypothetical protein
MVPAITARDEMIAPAPGTARTGPPAPPTTAVTDPGVRVTAGNSVADPAPVSVAGGRGPGGRPAARRAPRAPRVAVTPAAAPGRAEMLIAVTTGVVTPARAAGRARRGRPGRSGRRAAATAIDAVRRRVVTTARPVTATSRTATVPPPVVGVGVRSVGPETTAPAMTEGAIVGATAAAEVARRVVLAATRAPVRTAVGRTTAVAGTASRTVIASPTGTAVPAEVPAGVGPPRPRAAGGQPRGSSGPSVLTDRTTAPVSGRPTAAGAAMTAAGAARPRALAPRSRATPAPTATAVVIARPSDGATATGRPARDTGGVATTAGAAERRGTGVVAVPGTVTAVARAATARIAHPVRGRAEAPPRVRTPRAPTSRDPIRVATGIRGTTPAAPIRRVRTRRAVRIPGGPVAGGRIRCARR